jgi:glucan-binding YG repeat protein
LVELYTLIKLGGVLMKRIKLILSLVMLLSILSFTGKGNEAEAATTYAGKFIRPTSGTNTSSFGHRNGSMHYGVDIANSTSVPIAAAADGVVIRSEYSSSYGEVIYIRHKIDGIDYVTVYAHMETGTRKVSYGDSVKQGQIIGYMGNTGNSTGKHLHFEIHVGTQNWNKYYAKDPYDYIPKENYNSWLKTTSGEWIYYDGYQRTGWIYYDGNWYYLDQNTGLMKTRWVKDNGYWYFLAPIDIDTIPQGAMLTGWQKINDRWYYLNPSKTSSAPEGAMLTGWQKINSRWYYFNPVGNATDPEGAMLTGWQKIDSKWYYFNPVDNATDPEGAMLTGWQTIDGKDYYFYSDGVMAANTTIDGRTLGPDGAAIN